MVYGTVAAAGSAQKISYSGEEERNRSHVGYLISHRLIVWHTGKGKQTFHWEVRGSSALQRGFFFPLNLTLTRLFVAHRRATSFFPRN